MTRLTVFLASFRPPFSVGTDRGWRIDTGQRVSGVNSITWNSSVNYPRHISSSSMGDKFVKFMISFDLNLGHSFLALCFPSCYVRASTHSRSLDLQSSVITTPRPKMPNPPRPAPEPTQTHQAIIKAALATDLPYNPLHSLFPILLHVNQMRKHINSAITESIPRITVGSKILGKLLTRNGWPPWKQSIFLGVL